LWGGYPTSSYGVKAMNGQPTVASGNTFSAEIPVETGEHYNNQSTNLVRYFYYSGDVAEEPTDYSGPFERIAIEEENTCPSDLEDNSYQGHSGGFITSTITDYNTYSADLETKRDTYRDLVNGGNTDSLLTVIAGLTRDNRDTLHTLLVDFSPYLTEEVIKATLDHPIIKYPHAWGYELVELNIEVAYEPGFMTFLENKLNPFTPEMIADVQALLDSNASTDMLTKQLEIADLEAKKAYSANLLLQSLKNDTVSIDVDSIRYWINAKNDVLAKTREVDTYLQSGDYTEAETALTALDTDIQNYPDHLQDESTDYVAFKEKLIDLYSNGNPLDSLSEADHNFITDIAENGEGLGQYQAREMLCFFYNECADYPIDLIGQQNMAPTSTDAEALEVTVERTFKIYPNPAGTWVAIELPTVDEALHITVVDLTGRLVYQKQLGGINNTDRLSAVEVWDTSLIGEGNYLITITNMDGSVNYGTQMVVIQN